MMDRLRQSLPQSRLGWVFLATTVLSWLVILSMIAFVVAPTFGVRSTIGGHGWDQMESHRYLLTKTIFRFHQFPFWDPYLCCGPTPWGGVRSAATTRSPSIPLFPPPCLPP